jgi:hypothetical protein
MSARNRPVTSREYKLMLNIDRFKQEQERATAFFDLLKFLVKKNGGTIAEKQDKSERRNTSYLDTPELALHQRGFALRVREEKDPNSGFQLNLKYRAADRYLSASQNLSTTGDGKSKFEEDILPPFVSKFSHSATIKRDTEFNLNSVKDVTALFPGVQDLGIDPDTPIRTVNAFQAREVVQKLGKVEFDPETEVKPCLSFWYFQDVDAFPLVAEFSFDYDISKNHDKDTLETYPSGVVEGANRLFADLQRQSGWFNFDATTKTAFALETL